MGNVYRARDTRLGRDVAIKMLRSETPSDTGQRSRLEREARTIASLNHPNICTLHDIGPDYLVMEYVEGRTLDQLIPRTGLRFGEALRYAAAITNALAAAHAAGVVHRDLNRRM